MSENGTNGMLWRKTSQGRKGRFSCITPDNSDLRFLHYGRIILDREMPDVDAETGGNEVSLICVKGEGSIAVDGTTHTMRRYDALFLPPGTDYRVMTADLVDLIEAAAPSDKAGAAQFISYSAARKDPELSMRAGKAGYARDIVKLIDRNVDASRLLVGVTFGEPANWTSWAPHEHADSREEIYLYIDMPPPAFGIQMVYDNLEKPDLVAPVFEDDAIVITRGYHPNAGIPGYGINFLWMMAALTPETDREWADMHWQEEFAGKY